MDKSEFTKLFRDLNKSGFSEYEAHKLFSLIDVNGDEKIEFDEFMCIFKDTVLMNDKILIEWMFETIDKDKSGFIDKTELTKFISDNNVNFNTEEMNELIMNIDVDGNGNVDRKEFLLAMTKEFEKNN